MSEPAVPEPRTEAGRRVLAKANREPPLGFLPPEDVLAIEAEAAAPGSGALRDAAQAVVQSWFGSNEDDPNIHTAMDALRAALAKPAPAGLDVEQDAVDAALFRAASNVTTLCLNHGIRPTEFVAAIEAAREYERDAAKGDGA